ncbi:MAG: ATP-binding protein [Chloroflexota bacterium]|nr:ATP-binding protein [Chloroflexota bacterium]
MARPRLLILCGLPFAGKTTLARELEQRRGFARVEIDAINAERGVWDDRHGMSPEEWDETYRESYRRLEAPLRKGRSVIYDATNFTREQRDRPRAIAARHGVPATVIYLDVPEAEARRRWQRNREAGLRADVRDEDFALVVGAFEPPAGDEAAVRYDPSVPLDEWIARLGSDEG